MTWRHICIFYMGHKAAGLIRLVDGADFVP